MIIFPEPFLESVPQLHTLWIIFLISKNGLISCEKHVPFDTLFIATYSTSVVTASFGIAKFIKSGPARIVKNDKYLMGFGTLSFILIFINIALTIFGRGLLIGFFVDYVEKQGASRTYFLLILLCFIPQLLHVS